MRYGVKRLISLLTALVMVSSFVVVPAAAANLDESYLKNGYFITIYANDKSNADAQGLLTLVGTKKGSYEIGGIKYTATWTGDTDNVRFKPKGSENIWYAYTATLQGRNETPKAYVRVIPVNATQTLDTTSKDVTKDVTTEDIAKLNEENFETGLGLPAKVTVKYSPVSKPEEAGEFTLAKDTPKEYNIIGWTMEDGNKLTLQALKNAGAKKLELTPVYDEQPIPGWATLEEKPTFTLNIKGIAGTGEIQISGNSVRMPGVFEYGTSLGEILDLNGLSARLNGETVEGRFTLPENPGVDEFCDVGTHNKTININFVTKDGLMYNGEVSAAFTIEPAVLDSFSAEDRWFIPPNAYYATIYASDDENKSENALKAHLKSKRGNYTTTYIYPDKEGPLKLNATWSADANNPDFNPKGHQPVWVEDKATRNGQWVYEWYSYTAKLSPPADINKNNLEITTEPKAYIRVIPVKAVQTFSQDSLTLTVDEVEQLTETTMMDQLPKEATATYVPFVEVGEFKQPEDGTYSIQSWKIGENSLTLNALKEEAAKATDEKDVEVKLTPVYAPNNNIPEWATLEDTEFTLIITRKQKAENIEVGAPGSITYGEGLGDPTITVNKKRSENGAVPIDGVGTITCRYVGVKGTEYGPSLDKPANAGSYRVVATLESSTHSGRWTSNTFDINRKEVELGGVTRNDEDQITGIEDITAEDKVYDGTTDAALDATKAEIVDTDNSGIVEGDESKLKVMATGYFCDYTQKVENGRKKVKIISRDGADLKDDEGGVKVFGKDAGEGKMVAIASISLSGDAADNYTLKLDFELGGETAVLTGNRPKITARPLEIDDSEIAVTKVKSEKEASSTLTGNLKLIGVAEGEGVVPGDGVYIDMENVTVGEYKSSDVGTSEVTLSGIALCGKDKDNYSLQGVTDGKYTFTKAEITDKPRPVLGTNFTVEIPEVPYDGKPHAATVTAKDDADLGTPTVTYAKQKADGSYDTADSTAPVNAGTYKVIVSFAGSDQFAAAEVRNAITAGTLTIRKASVTATANIEMPTAATRTVLLSDLNLSGDVTEMPKDAKIMSVEHKSVAGEIGRNFFTLTTDKSEEDKTDTFTLLLRSENYSPLTVTVTVTAKANTLDITPPVAKVKWASTQYGTKLSEFIELTGGSVKLNGDVVPGEFTLKDPDKVYDIGEYENENIYVVFNSRDGKHKDVSMTVHATFTIVKSDGEGGEYDISGEEIVYFTIYANSENNNTEETLREFVRTKKPKHKVGETLYDVTWKAIPDNAKFERKGYKDNVWYSYTDSVGDNTAIWAHIRVIPVNATPSIKEKTLTADEIRKLTSLDNLPQDTPVSYAPAENVENPTENFTETTGTWKITSWKMDGKDLTLEALKAKVSGAGSENVTVTLIPVYSNVPAWATFAGGSDDGNGGGGNGSGNNGGGGSIGGGGGGVPTNPGNTTNPDGSKTTVETKEDGTVITTTVDAQGNETRTEKKPDGSIRSTVHHKNGCSGTIETDTAGKTIAVVDVPSAVAGGAAGGGSAVPLPVVGIRADKDIDKAPAMVVNTAGVNGVKVRIPVENMSLTVVAVEIKSDGTPVIIKKTIPTKDGILVRVNDGEVIRFLDNSKSFADTKGHWAADAVDFVSSRELFNGTSPDTFSPNAKMTRGMLVTVLARYEDVDTQGGSTWYEKGAAWAKANGLSDGTNLNGDITREQLATIMYRYADFQGKLDGTDAGLHGYTDAGRVSSWAADAMSWAVGVGLIKGTTPTTLAPQGSATRAQVAAIIMRYAEMFGL